MSTSFKLCLLGLLCLPLLLPGCGANKSRQEAVEHYVNALTLESAQQDNDAIYELEQAVRVDEQFSVAYSLLGDLYKQQGQLDKAAGAYEQACNLDPLNFKDHLSLGQVYQALHRFADAVIAFQKATQIEPNNAQANYALAVCYVETQQMAEAAKYCTRAAELDPTNPEIRLSLGDIHNKSNDPYKAINAYKQAFELDTTNANVLIKLGTVYTDLKQFDPARQVLALAVKLAPAAMEPRLAMGYCLVMNRQYQEALPYYQEAVTLGASNFKAFKGLGVTYILLYSKDRTDKQLCRKALECWHKSLELNPDQDNLRGWITRYTHELELAPAAAAAKVKEPAATSVPASPAIATPPLLTLPATPVPAVPVQPVTPAPAVPESNPPSTTGLGTSIQAN